MKRLVIVLLFILSGCASMVPSGFSIDQAISEYRRVESQISLGDDMDQVMALLMPIQEKIPASARKSSDKFLLDNVSVEIHYIRSGRQPDDLTTDDEFTPYIFHDGKLIGVGWQLLGGPVTRGQVVPNASNSRQDQNSRAGGSNTTVTRSTGGTGHFVRESVSGFNKTCYYSGIRGEFTTTVRSTSICPLTARQ